MSFAGIQSIIDFYTLQEAALTSRISDIVSTVTRASRDTSSLVEDTDQKRQSIYSKASEDKEYKGSDQYDEDLQKVNDEYELKLARITEWESELETQKQTLETELKATTSYKSSFETVLKQNIEKDFKYGDTSS